MLSTFGRAPTRLSAALVRSARSRRAFFATESTASPPPLSRTRKVARITALTCLSTIVGTCTLAVGILVHDAFTYNNKHVDRVPINPLALCPERGGPKNLPVVRSQVDDEEDEEAKRLAEKPKLVIVGGGWGVRRCIRPLSLMVSHLRLQAMGVLQNLHPGDYHITVVSTETFTTFTPLLPCLSLPCLFSDLNFMPIPAAIVGTVQVRSLVEPIRKIIARLRGHFVSGKAVDIVMSDRLLEVETTSTTGKKANIYVPYELFPFFSS